MGWTGFYDWDSSESNKEILLREYRNWGVEFLEASQKGSHVWFLCKSEKDGQIFAFVALCKREKDEFWRKEIELSSGPCEIDMPASWISRLSPEYLESGYCQDWLRRYNEGKITKKASKSNYPTWSKLNHLQNLICIFGCDNSAGKKDEVIKAWWDADRKMLRYKNYGVSKNQIKKIFSKVEVSNE